MLIKFKHTKFLRSNNLLKNILFSKSKKKFEQFQSQINNLLNDPAYQMNTLNNNILDLENDLLSGIISQKLNKKYLQKSIQTQSQIKQKTQYEGILLNGDYDKKYISIPTRINQSNKYINVHYLIDTKSSITKLSYKVLCILHEKQYIKNNIFLPDIYDIGGNMIDVHPQKQKNQGNFNLLGTNFFKKWGVYHLKVNTRNQSLKLILGEQKSRKK